MDLAGEQAVPARRSLDSRDWDTRVRLVTRWQHASAGFQGLDVPAFLDRMATCVDQGVRTLSRLQWRRFETALSYKASRSSRGGCASRSAACTVRLKYSLAAAEVHDEGHSKP